MSENENYQGWTNRETWAFMLHINNDQGLYNETNERAREYLSTGDVLSDYDLGKAVVDYWDDGLGNWADDFGTPLPEALAMFRNEVGSWWRVNYTEVGAAVRESLENES